MKRSKLVALKEKLCANSKKPWACFESTGPDSDGRVAFSISANKAFLKNLRDLGMGGINDEETMQMFFLQSRMVPEDEADDDRIYPDANPSLGKDGLQFKRGDLHI